MNKRDLAILKIGFNAGKKAIEMHPEDNEYDEIRLGEAIEQVNKNNICQNVVVRFFEGWLIPYKCPECGKRKKRNGWSVCPDCMGGLDVV